MEISFRELKRHSDAHDLLELTFLILCRDISSAKYLEVGNKTRLHFTTISEFIKLLCGRVSF